MKSRISCFNRTVFFKNVTRYFPAWLVYTILGLLISQTGVFGISGNYNASRTLAGSTGFMGAVMFVYAGVVANLIFGDLCRSRMCNALHALPIRRETWFMSHLFSALALCIVPNLGLAVLMFLQLGSSLWYTAFLWLAMVSIQAVFFLGLAIFSMVCVGRRFAAWVVYVMLNFGVLLVRWVISALILPSLYGVSMESGFMQKLSPLLYVANLEELWQVEHLNSCSCREVESFRSVVRYHSAQVTGMGDWSYLWILLAVGIAFLAGALVLYRRRHMERAGDFVTVKPLQLILPLVCAVFAGMIFYLFGQMFLLLLLGMPTGFFLCRMLVERKGNVFGGKNWLRLGILMSAFLLFVGLGRADVLGIERRVPQLQRVEKVVIAERYLSGTDIDELVEDWQREEAAVYEATPLGVDPSYRPGKQNMLVVTEEAQIGKIMDIHRQILKEGDTREHDVPRQVVTVHYILTDGSTMTRHYYPPQNGKAIRMLKEFTRTPEYILGAGTPEELVEDLYAVYLDDGNKLNSRWFSRLAQALIQDAREGNLTQDFYDVATRTIYLEYRDENGRHWEADVRYSDRAVHTVEVLKQYELSKTP